MAAPFRFRWVWASASLFSWSEWLRRISSVRSYASVIILRASKSMRLPRLFEYGLSAYGLDSLSSANDTGPTARFMPKSFWAPVVMRLKVRFSAARPPSAMHILSNSCSREYSFCSFGVYWAKPSARLVRGTMVTFSRTSELGSIQPTSAWPDSWNAITRLSVGERACERFSVPPTNLSTAYSRLRVVTEVWLVRAACSAASLHTLAMSAPEKPGVSVARRDE
uniref:Uncharacterized protein n=1 Tax=Anopheles atroparvus TaxID=41427 RepID=A0A182J5P4_ANOAO